MRRNGALARSTSTSRNDPARRAPRRADTAWTRERCGRQEARSSNRRVDRQALVHDSGRRQTSDEIGHEALDPPEVRQPGPEGSQRDGIRRPDRDPVEWQADERRSEPVDDSDHRVEVGNPAAIGWNEAHRVDDRRREHPELQQERHDVPHVAVHRAQCRQRRTHCRRREGASTAARAGSAASCDVTPTP